MGLLNANERRRLIDLLLRLPNIDDPATRRLLLANLPPRLQENVLSSNIPSIHISNIVDTVNSDAWTYLRDESLAVAVVIDNAIQMIEGSSLTKELEALQNRLYRSYDHHLQEELDALPNIQKQSYTQPTPSNSQPSAINDVGTSGLEAVVQRAGTKGNSQPSAINDVVTPSTSPAISERSVTNAPKPLNDYIAESPVQQVEGKSNVGTTAQDNKALNIKEAKGAALLITGVLGVPLTAAGLLYYNSSGHDQFLWFLVIIVGLIMTVLFIAIITRRI